MPIQSCFGEHWEIPKFKMIFRTRTKVHRPAETLFLGEGLGWVKFMMDLESIRRKDTYNLEINVMMEFHDTPTPVTSPRSDIEIDFFVVCGDFHHDVNTKLNKETRVRVNYFTRNYQCYKEKIDTDSSLTPNDTLTLAVRYGISPVLVQVPIGKATYLDRNPIVDMERIFDDEKFTDFLFSVQGEEFKVHRVIVASRSTVFEAMMEHDMKEKSENRAEITDVDPAAFKEMLRFIYTGKVENLAQIVDGLIKVADKYDLVGLKEICEDHLSEGLCPDNAIELLKQANVFNCERLKAQAHEYIIRNIARICATDAWKSLDSHLPAKLIGEICQSLSTEKIALRCERFRSSKKRKNSSSESDTDSSSDDDDDEDDESDESESD